MQQKEKIIKVYQNEGIAKTFDVEREQYEYQKYKHKFEKGILLSSFLNEEEVKVLDVACGTGRMLPEVLKNRKARYYGIDTSKNMMKYLKIKCENMSAKKRVAIKIGDASKIPYPDDHFDVTFSYHLLWHLPQELQLKIIGEMIRVTKKDGIIIFDILNKNFLWDKIKFLFGIKRIPEIYKLPVGIIEEIVSHKSHRIYKLSDAHIKNKTTYRLFNFLNVSSKFLPSFLFHMLYFKVRK